MQDVFIPPKYTNLDHGKLEAHFHRLVGLVLSTIEIMNLPEKQELATKQAIKDHIYNVLDEINSEENL
ncbi:MAG: hypothetical protein VKL60_13540 [Sphaerospermopsis sp.]|nr:hypothetical protein [Sphaerospermopsis sp.]